MTNNILKNDLIKYVLENKMNLISFENEISEHLETSNFTVKILTNKTVIHEITFNYHLKLLSYELKGDISKFLGTNSSINSLLSEARRVYKVTVGGLSINK